MTVREAKRRAISQALAPYARQAQAAQARMVSARTSRDETFRELYSQGVPARLIAEATGLSEQGVRAIVKRRERNG
jgi:DNA-binding NarL/FixJ family response regulator